MKRWCSIVLLLLMSSLAAQESQPSSPAASPAQEKKGWTLQEAEQALRQLIDDPTYPLRYAGFDEALKKHEFKGRGLDSFIVDLEGGYIWHADFESRRDRRRYQIGHPLFNKVLVKKEEAFQKALRIARKNFPSFEQFNMVLISDGDSPFQFHWWAQDQKSEVFLPVEVTVYIDQLNGNLTGFYGLRGEFRLRDPWTLTQEEAVALARQVDERFREAKVRVRKYTTKHGITGRYLDLWEVEVLLYKQWNGQEYGPVVLVDDELKKVYMVLTPLG